MPGEDVCHSENVEHDGKFADNRRRAHNLLCDIAKHLAAMKEGDGRLSKEAKRKYLQVSFNPVFYCNRVNSWRAGFLAPFGVPIAGAARPTRSNQR